MTSDEQKTLHAEIVALFQRYQDLAKQTYALQATLGELDKDLKVTGQKIYMLYNASGNGLNGDIKSCTPGSG